VDELPRGISAVTHLHNLVREPVERGSPRYQQVRTELGIKGLPSFAHELKLDELSGGQKARVVFAAIAILRPHVLLMDEPTNHLDLESIDALIDAVNGFEGGVLLISHDRRLLQQTDCALWICEKQSVSPLKLGYDAYQARVLAALERREEAERARARARAEERRKKKEQAAKAAAKAAKAKAAGGAAARPSAVDAH
jgi:ATP-binding cassette subfamily F protein 1